MVVLPATWLLRVAHVVTASRAIRPLPQNLVIPSPSILLSSPLPHSFCPANQSHSAPLLAAVVAHGAGTCQALARPRVSSSPLLRVVLHLPRGMMNPTVSRILLPQLW
jgi:hypothetical protein